MATCECLANCQFYNDKLRIESGLSQVFKNQYCLGDNSNCARYRVFKLKGLMAVPLNLYPNMLTEADKIIAAKPVKPD